MAEPGPDERDILVGELRIVKYINGDGELRTVDLSQGSDGGELSEDMYEHLIGWANAFALAPKVVSIIAAMNGGSDGVDG